MIRRRLSRFVPPAIAALGATVVIAGFSMAAAQPEQRPRRQPQAQQAPAGQPDVARPGEPPPIGPLPPEVVDAARVGEGIATVAERVSPVVVSIRVEQQVDRRSQFGGGMPFPFGGGGGDGQGDSGVARGAGSGVVISPDGYILTNNHVVENASRIEVHMQDGRTFRGQVVGTDPATDLAVIRIAGRSLPSATFADSSRARVGEWVVAIGSPFGLDYTVTAGVLSATGRGGLGVNEIEDYLQTDASINPGNSGGPLVNLRGEVLGINTMIVGRGTGIGFAIPSDLASNVATQLIQTGVVRRAWIGVGFQELTPELAAQFGTQTRTGALISNVVGTGPAARAGLQAGDIVVSVDSRPVREGRDLLRAVLRQPIGSRVQVGLLRRGRQQTVTLVTTERPDANPGRRTPRPAQPQPQPSGWGMQIQPLTPQIRQQIGYSGNGAVVVSGVADGSIADRAGIQPGDVIVEADRNAVTTPQQVLQALSDGTALLRVMRRDGSFYAVVARDSQ
jgi:Do/DeqQ family serine protease